MADNKCLSGWSRNASITKEPMGTALELDEKKLRHRLRPLDLEKWKIDWIKAGVQKGHLILHCTQTPKRNWNNSVVQDEGRQWCVVALDFIQGLSSMELARKYRTGTNTIRKAATRGAQYLIVNGYITYNEEIGDVAKVENFVPFKR